MSNWPRGRRIALTLTALIASATMIVAGCGDNGNGNGNGGSTLPGGGGGGASPTPSGQSSTSGTPTQVETATPDADLDAIPRTTDRNLTLTGAGATFPNVLYSRWSDEYNQLNNGIRINYQSVGSGAGIRQVIEKTVDFGGTDGPMNDEQKEAAGSTVLHIPMAMGAVVPAINLPGDPEVQFSQETIAAIFLGEITNWNDPAILEDNPGLDVGDLDIAVVHRSDGSGTTFIWVDFLSAISDEWREGVGVGTSVSWPTGLGANGNEGVANQVRQIPGAIGYVELAYATQNNLVVGSLENADGEYVRPTFEGVAAAAGGLIDAGEFPDDMEARVVNAPGANSWPAAGFTWVLIYEELNVLPQITQESAEELIRYVLWCLDADGGQQWNIGLDYAPLDPLVLDLARENLKKVTLNGSPVWEAMAE